MLWIGEVEDAKYIDEPTTPASITGRPILDFEKLDFKIASGLRKVLTGDFFKIRGDNDAIWDFRDFSKVQLENDNVQAFDTRWDEVLSAVTDRPADSILDSVQDASRKVGSVEILVASPRSRDDIRRLEV